MPPKSYRKSQPSYSASQAQKQQQKGEQINQNHQQLFVNPKNLVENSKTLQRIRILVSLLSGIISGLLNVNQLIGPLIYMAMHGIITLLIIIKVGDSSEYFMKKTDVWSGIGAGVLIFLCAWMIVYNIVYTL